MSVKTDPVQDAVAGGSAARLDEYANLRGEVYQEPEDPPTWWDKIVKWLCSGRFVD